MYSLKSLNSFSRINTSSAAFTDASAFSCFKVHVVCSHLVPKHDLDLQTCGHSVGQTRCDTFPLRIEKMMRCKWTFADSSSQQKLYAVRSCLSCFEYHSTGHKTQFGTACGPCRIRTRMDNAQRNHYSNQSPAFCPKQQWTPLPKPDPCT